MSLQATVHVVEDDERVRRTLRRLIESVGLKAETYASALEFLAEWDDHGRGCLVLDVRMPGLDGLGLQEALEDKGMRIPIVFITGHGNIPMSVRAMKAGAVDFIQKPFDDKDLLDAIDRAIAQDDRTRREQAIEDEVMGRLDLLTNRERQVLPLVVAGLPNKRIALQLGVSEKTIKVHRANVMQKMGAESLPDLVLLAQVAGVCKQKTQPN